MGADAAAASATPAHGEAVRPRRPASGSASQASTAVHAAEWTTASGRSAVIAPSTSSRSVTSSVAWSPAATSSPAAAQRPDQLGAELAAGTGDEDRMRLQAREPFRGSHHHRLSRYQATVSASASSKLRCGRQPSALTLVDVDRVAAVVAEPVGDVRRSSTRRAPHSCQQPVGELEVGDLVAGADVVDLADGAPAQHEVDGRGSGPRRGTSRARCRRRRTAAPSSPSSRLVVNSGMTFSGNWYGPKLFDERVTTTGSP